MKQKIRIWLRNFFGFSRTETNGFIILILLMIIILAAPFISKSLYSLYEQPLQSANDKASLNSLLAELENNVKIKKQIVEKEQKYKALDLNTSSIQHIISAGFPDYLAERIVKYRNKVKPFESREELLKIYGIDSTFYKQIYPYLSVSKLASSSKLESSKINDEAHQFDVEKTTPKHSRKVTAVRIDINKADSMQLQEIHGIGPTFSKRIIKYREYLGGFHSIQQLGEVYGLKKENLDSLKKYVLIEKRPIVQQLKVNQLSVDSLVQHPYISYKEANLLVNYRKQHGDYKSVSDLLSIKVLDSIWVEKVKPYFTFD